MGSFSSLLRNTFYLPDRRREMNSKLPQSTNIICYNLFVSVADYQTHRLDPGELLSNQRLGESQDAGGLEPGGVRWRAAESAPICSTKKKLKEFQIFFLKKKGTWPCGVIDSDLCGRRAAVPSR